jgi:hypothetical protein
MKKTVSKFLSLALVGFLLVGAFSCDDPYTEEDALKAQQEIDLTIYVVDKSLNSKPIANAKVTVSQAGATKDVTTDDKGIAQFPKIKVGSYVYTVTADNYTSQDGTGNASPDNFREGQVTRQVTLYSLTDENSATIQGKVTMEKDLTNLTPEAAAGIKVFFDIYLNNVGYQTFTATTDAQGAYTIKVPTNGALTSTSVYIRYQDFEADQVIAVNKYADEAGTFLSIPQVLPRKETIKTLFSQNYSGSINMFYTGSSTTAAFGMRSLYATVEAPPAGGTLATIASVETNSLGEVTGVTFNTGGNYTGDADGKVNVTIVSLDGGSGASIQVALAGNASVLNAYSTIANRTIVKGAGYPANNVNFTLNKVDLRYPSAATSLSVSPSNIYYANGDYGTGVARPRLIVR